MKINYFKGTQRIIAPNETIKNNIEKLKLIGINELKEITHLDRIGIPVFTAIREKTSSGKVGVYAGKGITTEHAKASAIMEAFERYSAERNENLNTQIATINDLKNNYIHPKEFILPKKTEYNDQIAIEWSKSYDIVSGEEYLIPTNTVYHPYIPKSSAFPLFKAHTNGLASGNVLEEAILHGIYEVIERDAWSIFELTKKNSKEIDLDSIENKNIQDILSKFEKNDIDIKLMDWTADVKVPTIAASSDDKVLKDPSLLTIGVGTHLNPEIAVLRALTEVAQSRASELHGGRKDAVRADFIHKAGYERMKKINKHYFEKEENKINFNEIEDKSTDSLTKNIDIVKDELVKKGLNKILYTDLTRDELGINVVRVNIPEMELFTIDRERAGNRCLKF